MFTIYKTVCGRTSSTNGLQGGAVCGHELNCKKSTGREAPPGSRREAVNIPITETVGDTKRNFPTHESGWLDDELGVTNRNAKFRVCAEHRTENYKSNHGVTILQ